MERLWNEPWNINDHQPLSVVSLSFVMAIIVKALAANNYDLVAGFKHVVFSPLKYGWLVN